MELYFSNNLQQKIHCEPKNAIEWVFPTNCNKKSIVSRRTQWSLLFQQIATGEHELWTVSLLFVVLWVCARASAHFTIYLWAGSSKLALEAEIQMLKFEEHQGESSTKFLHSIAGMAMTFRSFCQPNAKPNLCLKEQKRACENGGIHCQMSSGSGDWEIFVG